MAALPDWMRPPRAEGCLAEDLDRLPEAPHHTERVPPDRRRLRVGDYRVAYTIDNGELVVRVVHEGHRPTVHNT
ncbi:type II toxin-antitoxin system RelE/ParE family toxin [Streptomyces sp. NPDC090045]|uniref:type II toxin-antitoxin system RelE family toxin n=1 Tax=Streptomyces sp. NPDC090045 TaxID=3365927 RepID=UPI0037F23995